MAQPSELGKRQLLGVFAPEWVQPLAEVLRDLGHERAWVMHGADGVDELSTSGASQVVELKDGKLRAFEVTPEDAGLPRATLDDLKGGDAEHNAGEIRALLDGRPGPFRDVVLLGSAAALIVADKAEDLKDGVALAAAAIDDGRAQAALSRLAQITNEAGPPA